MGNEISRDLSLRSVSHYNDAIMGAIGSQITSLTIVYSTVYSGADQSKHQSSVSLAFVWGIHRGPVNSPHKWPVTRKMFPFDDVIMGVISYIATVAWYGWQYLRLRIVKTNDGGASKIHRHPYRCGPKWQVVSHERQNKHDLYRLFHKWPNVCILSANLPVSIKIYSAAFENESISVKPLKWLNPEWFPKDIMLHWIRITLTVLIAWCITGKMDISVSLAMRYIPIIMRTAIALLYLLWSGIDFFTHICQHPFPSTRRILWFYANEATLKNKG